MQAHPAPHRRGGLRHGAKCHDAAADPRCVLRLEAVGCAVRPRSATAATYPKPRRVVAAARISKQPWPGGLNRFMYHTNVLHVKAATIHELMHDITTALKWVAAGESVDMKRRGRPVAILSPQKRKGRCGRPGSAAPLRAAYGDEVLGSTATELPADSR